MRRNSAHRLRARDRGRRPGGRAGARAQAAGQGEARRLPPRPRSDGPLRRVRRPDARAETHADACGCASTSTMCAGGTALGCTSSTCRSSTSGKNPRPASRASSTPSGSTSCRPPADYRAQIRFRWYDKKGRLQRSARKTTRACRQPDPRPDLRVLGFVSLAPGRRAGRAAATRHRAAQRGPVRRGRGRTVQLQLPSGTVLSGDVPPIGSPAVGRGRLRHRACGAARATC